MQYTHRWNTSCTIQRNIRRRFLNIINIVDFTRFRWYLWRRFHNGTILSWLRKFEFIVMHIIIDDCFYWNLPCYRDRWVVTFEIYLLFTIVETMFTKYQIIWKILLCIKLSPIFRRSFPFTDISPPSMEYESGRTTMDHPNIVYCTHIRTSLLGQFVVFQQRALLRVLLYN